MAEHNMSIDKVQTVYSIEIGQARLQKIFDREDSRAENDLLDNHLYKVDGVDNVQYDPHFGTFVNVTIAAEEDGQKKQQEIMGVIQDFVEGKL